MVHSSMFLLTWLIACANLKDYWDALQSTQHITYVGSAIRLDICFAELFLKAVFSQKRLINISKKAAVDSPPGIGQSRQSSCESSLPEERGEQEHMLTYSLQGPSDSASFVGQWKHS